MAKFSLGCLIGFGLGYYLGTKAGPERYEDLRAVIARTPLAKLQAMVDLGREPINPAAAIVVPPSPN